MRISDWSSDVCSSDLVRSAETMTNRAGYHTLSRYVGKIAAEAGVKALALTHFVPPAADRAALLAEVAADFAGPLVLAEDLLRIDLAARDFAMPTRICLSGICLSNDRVQPATLVPSERTSMRTSATPSSTMPSRLAAARERSMRRSSAKDRKSTRLNSSH